MTHQDHEHQAVAFVEWYERGQSGPWEEAFHRWGGPGGKELAPQDYARIRRIATLEMIARGTLSPDFHHYEQGVEV